MRAKLIESNKPEHYIHPVRNVDTTPAALTIPVGSPLILNLSATPQPPVYTNGLPAGWEDGLQVVLPVSAAATNANNPTNFFYGVAMGPIIFQQLGESMLHGVCMAAVFRASRANTTLPWASGASVPGFDVGLSVDTVNNCFNTIGTSTAALPAPAAMCLDNLTTYASSASNATDTRLVLTQLCRAFVRQM